MNKAIIAAVGGLLLFLGVNGCDQKELAEQSVRRIEKGADKASDTTLNATVKTLDKMQQWTYRTSFDGKADEKRVKVSKSKRRNMSIESVMEKYEERLMQLPNVTIVGTGEKEGKPVIVVYVTHKVSRSQMQTHEAIPQTLDGYEVDVRESGPIQAHPR